VIPDLPVKGKIMPHIFDNIEQPFLTALCETISLFSNDDFCIGYFNLRG
jgi:hypothetical protein